MTRPLEVRDLSIAYPDERALAFPVRGATFAVDQGEILGIVGVSGSGKSVLARALTGYVVTPGRFTEGSIKVFGRELIGMPEADLRRIRGRLVGIITQNARSHLNPVLKIGKQIGNVYRAHHGRQPRAELRKRVVRMLHDVGIPAPEDRYKAYPHELSGGMAQRCMIAMALICSPRLLVADEPSSGLDVTIQDQVLRLFRALAKEQGAAAVLISRDMGIIANFCDRVAVMDEGRIVESETVDSFFEKARHPMSRALVAAASYGSAGPSERTRSEGDAAP
jgi:ABC-type dipeptide/oligopeptide/nickel transport system ATPase component